MVGAILQGLAALGNVYVGLESLKEAKAARKDANHQQAIENQRYDQALAKQEAYLNEVNDSTNDYKVTQESTQAKTSTPIADTQNLSTSQLYMQRY